MAEVKTVVEIRRFETGLFRGMELETSYPMDSSLPLPLLNVSTKDVTGNVFRRVSVRWNDETPLARALRRDNLSMGGEDLILTEDLTKWAAIGVTTVEQYRDFIEQHGYEEIHASPVFERFANYGENGEDE